MDRRRLMMSAVLAVVALARVLPGLNRHGLWFDEAYTARLASLGWARLVAGAQLDIHPPGWPIVSGLMLRLPIAPESALRLPAAVSFAALVALVGGRNVWAGVALLFYGPLVDQAGQGRPYLPLALGLVMMLRLVERRSWRMAGVVLAGVSSLHALGGALGLVTVFVAAALRQPRLRDVAWLIVPSVVLSAWWLPGFTESAVRYIHAPWYPVATSTEWRTVTDGGGAASAAALLILAAALDRDLRAVVPAIAVGAVLVGMEWFGIGAEVQKTGIVVLPLLFAGVSASRNGRRAVVASVALLAVTAAPLPDRPDLREAQRAVSVLGNHVPVISVFASEAAWYIRSPAPLPSFREPGAIAERIRDVVDTDRASCIVAMSLPGTFPSTTDLPAGVVSHLVADVTGLDVRLVGTHECAIRTPVGPWRLPGEP